MTQVVFRLLLAAVALVSFPGAGLAGQDPPVDPTVTGTVTDRNDGSALDPGAPPPPVPPATTARSATGQITIRAVRIDNLRLDGNLDEPVYRTVTPINEFIQIEPVAGAPASELTEAWIFFDDTHLYVGARAWNQAPESEWIANEMRRDSMRVTQNENVGMLLDTFYDRRNGVAFLVTPIGGRMDGQITNERSYNPDWNPIWTVRTGRFDGGWSFETAIPFKSLRYRPGRSQVWGLQLRRSLRNKNEVSFLTPLDPGLGRTAFFQVSQSATLVGLEVPEDDRLLEVKPYVIGDISSDLGASPPISNTFGGNAGLDLLKYGVTENVTADFTINTDFAQVEADEQQINLTRFSLFFPEKREFFLENQGTFRFGGTAGIIGGAGDAPLMFYSRQIGQHDGTDVPILVGGRLTGRTGAFDFGLLNIQTGEDPTVRARTTNFTVARLKRDVLRRSSIGAIMTHRSARVDGPGTSQTYGIDGMFSFYDNVSLNAYWAKTQSTGRSGQDTSYKGEFRYNGDRYGMAASHLFVDARFTPEVGFVRRDDFRKSFGSVRFSPRPRSFTSIRKFAWEASYTYITDAIGLVETREAQANFQTEFENSDSFDISSTTTYDFLKEPFQIHQGIVIPAGGYDLWNTRASFAFGQQRQIAGSLFAEHGAFYGGTKTAVGFGGGGPTAPRIELTPQLSVEPGLSFNWIDLPQGSLTTGLVRTRTTYTFMPTMFVSALVQYNSSNDTLSSNIRLRWEYQPGSELFVVYNEQRDTLSPRTFPELQSRVLVVKINKLFRF